MTFYNITIIIRLIFYLIAIIIGHILILKDKEYPIYIIIAYIFLIVYTGTILFIIGGYIEYEIITRCFIT